MDSLIERYSRIPVRNDGGFKLLTRDLKKYFEGYPVKFRYNTDLLEGGEFMKSVWKRLMDIPYGETRSYQWVAEQIGNPKACRAVGYANGKNPIPIIIPCHRVIQKNGLLGGYTGGIDIKKRLLEIENNSYDKTEGII